MKKALTLITLFVLVVALNACGTKSGEGTAPIATPAPAASTSPVTGNTQNLTVTAINWTFDQKEYTVKSGQPVKITLDSKQGLHGLRIADLKVNLDSRDNTTTITPDKPGTYEISCSVPCGSGHLNMKAKLVVQ